MDSDFWQYIDRLELMAFFSGYPLVYATTMTFLGNKKNRGKNFAASVSFLLPYAYALCGTLYLGLLMRNLYPDYSIKNIGVYFDHSYLKIWAMFSLLFWIPLFSKKPVFSLFHSLPFFIYLIRDVFLFKFSRPDHDMIKNEIKVYSDSLFLNIVTLAVIVLLYFFITIIRNKKSPSRL